MDADAVATLREPMSDSRHSNGGNPYCTDRFRKEILALLRGILYAHPEGISEYDLLVILRERSVPVFSDGKLSDALFLYRAHFLLFHLLYSLDDVARRGKECIEIHCMRIILRQQHENDAFLPAKPDSLRNYYRDLSQLDAMDRQGVDDLISQFWEMYASWDRRSDSFAELGLVEPVSRQEIKKRFRKLAKSHHPDCGGDPVRFARISEAAAVLLD